MSEPIAELVKLLKPETCPICQRRVKTAKELRGITGAALVCVECFQKASAPRPIVKTDEPCAHCRQRDRNTMRVAPSGATVPMCARCAERYAP